MHTARGTEIALDKIQRLLNSSNDRLLHKAIDSLEDVVISVKHALETSRTTQGPRTNWGDYPPAIRSSLQLYLRDHLLDKTTAFIMMQFGTTTAHKKIVETIKRVCQQNGIVAMRADDKQYHDNLLNNVLTYIHGADIGVAIFERIEADTYNPNVSFEVGYMRALNKPVCILKDRTIHILQTDLLGELYKSFDPLHPEKTIPEELERWLTDKGLIE